MNTFHPVPGRSRSRPRRTAAPIVSNCGSVSRYGAEPFPLWHTVGCSFFLTGMYMRQGKIPSENSPPQQPDADIETTVDQKDPDWKDVLLCRTCRQIITSPAERISVQGAHQHTFANPAGIMFQIGCFRKAAGCSYTGHPTDEFTWFTGFMWRIIICNSCLSHLGWLFSSGREHFHGFILNRLIPGISEE